MTYSATSKSFANNNLVDNIVKNIARPGFSLGIRFHLVAVRILAIITQYITLLFPMFLLLSG